MAGAARSGLIALTMLAIASCGDGKESASSAARDGATRSRQKAPLRDEDTPLAKMASVITRPEIAGVPRGYKTMRAVSAEHNTVLLVDEDETVIVPILIGTTETTSISLRLRRQAPPRPLTHDLLDAVLRELGAELVRVQVDDLRDGVFIGSVFIRQGARLIELDARPSDAIALAVGKRIPIYVAQHVVDYAGTPASGRLPR